MFDNCIKHLDGLLTYFSCWKSVTESAKRFILDKLWFDIQSMVHGFKAITQVKLEKLPESAIKPWFINEDVVENHFCQICACNGQNNNPTYRLQESAQNSIKYGQTLYLQSAMLHARLTSMFLLNYLKIIYTYSKTYVSCQNSEILSCLSHWSACYDTRRNRRITRLFEDEEVACKS